MKKLLILEDDPALVELVETMFSESDFTVLKSYKRIPFDEIARITPDIIILDYFLGGDLGSEICLELKASPLTQNIPVILYSAFKNLKELAIESCADGYIIKPFEIDEFMSMVYSLALKPSTIRFNPS
ncbi:response regulator transcription factor [Mucilaginibacter gotjawali]|uniref:Phosphate regulon transcriptional regulatory protein PhoB n=2 Tax=Mucilaginibacter gotjawali TaxID=1550579 RepID=A0A0X8X1E0_9SPHI|nr:response regulator [Mucilaginibacter gotjawali]MBB3055365.1 DNA-binding response OmpR family regulator [Mucilaginibacter gotjawali]BAU53358.1 Phosphate regulon transcriptional regulatory protein PhoB [Mucilaginibacter gotjawali]